MKHPDDGLIAQVAKRYMWALGAGLAFDDLIQAGRIGAERARQKYDPKLGAWSTYCVLWVRATINREVETNSRTLRLPGHVWRERRGNLPPRTLSLDDSIAGSDSLTIESRTADDAPSPLDEVERRDLDERVRAAIAQLEPRLRELVEQRFLHGRDLAWIGRRMTTGKSGRKKKGPGISRERVRQLERQALEQLKKLLADTQEVA